MSVAMGGDETGGFVGDVSCGERDGVHGLYTTKDVPKGTLLLSVPEACCIAADEDPQWGLSLRELSEDLGLADPELLADVERGEKILPIEHVLRAASLLARHDPVPFLIRFLRTYNPQLERALEDWGVMALPKQFERERRFINLYRQHDFLRDLSDDEFARFIDYMDSSTHLVADVMAREKAAWATKRKKPAPRRRMRPATARRATAKRSGD